MSKPLVNRVSQSGLIVISLDKFLPNISAISYLNIADYLFKGLLLREQDFRQAMADYDWSALQQKDTIIVDSSVDAIIPMWAYMLIASYVSQRGATVFFGTPAAYTSAYVLDKIATLDISPYQDQKVIIKGCSTDAVDGTAYGQIAARLTPIVKSLMFGEPCSTVPIYKRK